MFLKFISQKKEVIILALSAIIFFFIYSYLSFFPLTKFNSPDEALNYFFTERFVKNSTFTYDEPLNKEAPGLIHPRNSTVLDSKIVPFSFLGLYLIVGAVGKIFGLKTIMFVVPLLSAISSLFFYLLLKEIFSKKIALVSSIILLFHPAFWFFSSRAMFHNALFASLFIITFYFLIKALKSAKILYYILFGFFAGLAVLTRTSEIFWLLGLTISLFVIFRKNINIKNLAVSFFVFILVLTPMFYLNTELYGNPFTVGYFTPGGEVENGAATLSFGLKDKLINLFQKINKIFLPSGINFSKLYETISKYLVSIFIWFTFLFFVGIIYFLQKYKKIQPTKLSFRPSPALAGRVEKSLLVKLRDSSTPLPLGGFARNAKLEVSEQSFMPFLQKVYFWLFIFISLYLILYYGSGAYFGAHGEEETVVGSSLVRYWLPIYILSLPFIVFAFKKINVFFKRKSSKILISALLLIFSFLFSLNLLYINPAELLQAKSNALLFSEIEKEVHKLTEENSVIVASIADKFLFPERRVIGLGYNPDEILLSKDSWLKIKNLMDKVPVYYFTMYGLDLTYQNQKLRKEGLKLVPITTILDVSSLYKIEKTE